MHNCTLKKHIFPAKWANYMQHLVLKLMDFIVAWIQAVNLILTNYHLINLLGNTCQLT